MRSQSLNSDFVIKDPVVVTAHDSGFVYEDDMPAVSTAEKGGDLLNVVNS